MSRTNFNRTSHSHPDFRVRQDTAKLTLRINSAEEGVRHHYRCIDCQKRWRTTLPLDHMCPFCKKIGYVQEIG